ncbi:MAG TPA: hypothetical protein VK694_05805 [Verrucomicrobiae bacterium]|nr:hypothetical protein [Verrucomicrobiae bacterium]
MGKGPSLAKYIQERGKYFDSLSPGELKAQDELLAFLQKTTDNIEAKQDQVTTESNEYERQYTSFFALAISFIVAGLLSSPPVKDATQASRVLYFAAIITATLAAVFLLSEYIFVSRLFSKWQSNNERILRYIAQGQWNDPPGLETWINQTQSKVPKKSTRAILFIEIFLISLAFVLLALWLYETLFNPNWPLL